MVLFAFFHSAFVCFCFHKRCDDDNVAVSASVSRISFDRVTLP